jgi:hypothetical protein
MSLKSRVGSALSAYPLVLLNVLLCAAALWANSRYQLFCRPVPWATAVLVVSMVPLITYGLFRERIMKGSGVVFFLFGIAACVCVYCILFIGLMNFGALFGVFMKPYLLLLYLPHILLLQVRHHIIRSAYAHKWRAFGGGVALCLCAALFMGAWFRAEHPSVEAAIADPEQHAASVQPNYMTERMLGLHFKYHTALNLFDGWRPPLHDPLIVTALWLNYPFMDASSAKHFRKNLLRGGGPFFHTGPWDLQARTTVYKRVFPENPLRQECSCAKGYAKMYFDDPLWE